MSFRILKARSKAALRNVFDKHPMLDGLFAQMLYEPRFRVLLGLALAFLATLPFLLFPLIKASPEGFNPPLRVSGIDLIQAWNLKRTAVKQGKSRSFDASVFTWRMAIANNAADADLIRGLLRTVGQAEQPERYADVTVAYSRWLLRLTETNQFDLELVTSLYEQVGLYDLITATLAERSVVSDGPFALSHLKALFYQGDYERFKLAWERSRGTIKGDARAVAEMYHAAYDAMLGAAEGKSRARQQLDAAAGDPKLGVEAHRLKLHVTSQTLDSAGYAHSLERLANAGAATFWNRLAYWNLLLRTGQTNQALKLSREAAHTPQEPDQAVMLAKFYYDAHQAEEALRILTHYKSEFPDSQPLWISHANLLLELKKWDDLRGAAIEAQAGNSHLPDATAYACYFEAVANLHSNFAEEAERNLRKMLDHAGPVAQRVELAERVLALGFPAVARDLLRTAKPEFRNDNALGATFWCLLARSEFELRNLEGVEAALSRAHALQPEDDLIANNLAAALIASRRDPALALRLTTRIVNADRAWPGARVNHSVALIQSDRFEEAAKVLESIRVTEMSKGERAAYHLARFEIATHKKKWAEAKAIAALVDRKELLPAELQFFEKNLSAVEAASR